MIIWVDDYDSIEICAMAPYAEEAKPRGAWIREELKRAAERSNSLPSWARPVVTRPWNV